MNVKLFDEAMKIPPRERVAFAELILASIDHEDEDVKKKWVAEVKERIKSVQEGKSTLLDFNQLYAED
ncbi:MAG: addiction module protein [Mariprofundus sp.]|nr:addiction module protein [Mariprofundus sp.]